MPRAKSSAKPPRPKSIVLNPPPPGAEEKRAAFAHRLFLGDTQVKAGEAAGYAPNSAKNLARSEEVRRHLAEARSEVKSLTTIERLDVLGLFLEAVTMARRLEDPAQMIAGAREIGRMMGYYEADKVSLEIGPDLARMAQRFREMTDAELLRIASGAAAVIDGECETLQ
ncbi:MAG: hypothetical protein LBU11_12375 [Zoogloeaceae bacterium]|jgi:phage terminase small subunit|nr:hypothetical protein [Zoogloeaceae bacterium]